MLTKKFKIKQKAVFYVKKIHNKSFVYLRILTNINNKTKQLTC